ALGGRRAECQRVVSGAEGTGVSGEPPLARTRPPTLAPRPGPGEFATYVVLPKSTGPTLVVPVAPRAAHRFGAQAARGTPRGGPGAGDGLRVAAAAAGGSGERRRRRA